MSLTMFSVGRDTQLVVIGPAGRIDLTHVTSFESRQITHSVRVDRLDGTHMGTELPKGWEGSFELERGSSSVDDFIAAAEQQYFNGSSITPARCISTSPRRTVPARPTSLTMWPSV